jgi:hypothetical protein
MADKRRTIRYELPGESIQYELPAEPVEVPVAGMPSWAADEISETLSERVGDGVDLYQQDMLMGSSVTVGGRSCSERSY